MGQNQPRMSMSALLPFLILNQTKKKREMKFGDKGRGYLDTHHDFAVNSKLRNSCNEGLLSFFRF